MTIPHRSGKRDLPRGWRLTTLGVSGLRRSFSIEVIGLMILAYWAAFGPLSRWGLLGASLSFGLGSSPQAASLRRVVIPGSAQQDDRRHDLWRRHSLIARYSVIVSPIDLVAGPRIHLKSFVAVFLGNARSPLNTNMIPHRRIREILAVPSVVNLLRRRTTGF